MMQIFKRSYSLAVQKLSAWKLLFENDARPNGDTIHPIVILFTIVALAMLLTYVLDSGVYERDGKLVIPDSYTVLEKELSANSFVDLSHKEDGTAKPVSVFEMLMAIPEGMERTSGLIFMVLIIGGMFGILKEAGAIEAGLEKLIGVFRGNIYALTIGLMVVFSAGSTFLGLASEYLLIIPIIVAIANRFGMSNLVGLGIVTVGAKIGYLSSVTNPLPLTIAQPLVGLQVFSGSGVRLIFYLVFLVVGIVFMLFMIQREGVRKRSGDFHGAPVTLEFRHTVSLCLLALGIAFLVYASNTWQWRHEALSAYYLGMSVVFAVTSGLGPNKAAGAFVEGMKSILMASFLIGVAAAVSVVLEKGQVLDTVVHGLTQLVGDSGPYFAAYGMFVSQLLLDFLIPSTSGQAAVSMPILGPLGQLSGVEPQTTVVAFLFGNGLTNMLTPTSGTLLAYLATAKVSWTKWAAFIFPLWAIYCVISLMLLTIAVIVEF